MSQGEEVILAGENSAWDALKERFLRAAEGGDYIDVESGVALGREAASAAAESETAIAAIPAVMTKVAKPHASADAAAVRAAPIAAPAPPSGPLAAITVQIRATRALLTALRSELVENFAKLSKLAHHYASEAAPLLSRSLAKVKLVNARISTVQELVDKHLSLVRGDASMLAAIHVLNAVATKANIFIHEINANRYWTSGAGKSILDIDIEDFGIHRRSIKSLRVNAASMITLLLEGRDACSAATDFERLLQPSWMDVALSPDMAQFRAVIDLARYV